MDEYEVVLHTETGADFSRPSKAEVIALMRELDATGESWVIVDRIPAADEDYFQVLRETSDAFRVEIREGSAERHVAALVASAEAVDRLLASWECRGEEWRSACDWVPYTALR